MAKKSRVGLNDDIESFLTPEVLSEFLADPDVAKQLEGLSPEMRSEAMAMVTGLFGGEDVEPMVPFATPFFESVSNRSHCQEFTKQALSFLDAEPWKSLGGVVLAVEIRLHPSDEEPWFGIVIGRGDHFAGTAFFRSLDQLKASLFDEADGEESVADTILFFFDSAAEGELPRVVELGWPADEEDLVPAVVRIDEGEQTHGVSEEELLVCTLGLQVLSAVTSKFYATGQVVFDDVEVADSIVPFSFKVHHLGTCENREDSID